MSYTLTGRRVSAGCKLLVIARQALSCVLIVVGGMFAFLHKPFGAASVGMPLPNVFLRSIWCVGRAKLLPLQRG